MERRSLLLGFGSTGFAYIWIPRISIVKTEGGTREALVKAGEVIADGFGSPKIGKTSTVLSNSNSMEREKLTKSIKTLEAHSYSDLSADYYENRSRSHSMFGGYRGLVDYCHAYTSPKRREEAIAYLTSVTFICHSYIIDACKKADWSEDKITQYCYPSEIIEYWANNWGDSIGFNSSPPAHVHCERGSWSVEYSATTRSGMLNLIERETSRKLFEQSIEFN